MLRTINLDIKLETQECMPYRSSQDAAGWDLRSREKDFTLKPGISKEVHTGLFLELPRHICAIVLPRSGLGRDYELRLKNTVGLIDPDYRGEIIVHLKTTKEVTIKQYDRFAQILFLPFIEIVNLRVKEFLSNTDRGEAGFGASGVE